MLLYKQLVLLIMDFACSVWRSACCNNTRNLQVLKSKCPRIAISAPWYVSEGHIYEDLGIPFVAGQIRALIERFDSNLAGPGNPLFRNMESTIAYEGLSAGRFNRTELMLSGAVEPAPNKAA